MKIRIVQTVNVDPEKWATEYCLDPSEVREDVKEYFANIAQEIVDSNNLQPENHEG